LLQGAHLQEPAACGRWWGSWATPTRRPLEDAVEGGHLLADQLKHPDDLREVGHGLGVEQEDVCLTCSGTPSPGTGCGPPLDRRAARSSRSWGVSAAQEHLQGDIAGLLMGNCGPQLFLALDTICQQNGSHCSGTMPLAAPSPPPPLPTHSRHLTNWLSSDEQLLLQLAASFG